MGDKISSIFGGKKEDELSPRDENLLKLLEKIKTGQIVTYAGGETIPLSDTYRDSGTATGLYSVSTEPFTTVQNPYSSYLIKTGEEHPFDVNKYGELTGDIVLDQTQPDTVYVATENKTKDEILKTWIHEAIGHGSGITHHSPYAPGNYGEGLRKTWWPEGTQSDFDEHLEEKVLEFIEGHGHHHLDHDDDEVLLGPNTKEALWKALGFDELNINNLKE